MAEVAAAGREQGEVEYGSPHPLADSTSTRPPNTSKIMPDRAGFPAEDVLILEGTGALTPEMISAYSSE
jgi:hypothetical protein